MGWVNPNEHNNYIILLLYLFKLGGSKYMKAKDTKVRNLKGQVALITGGARGIGQSISLSLAREGANVSILDKLSLKETIRLLEKYKVESLGIKCDVSKKEEIKKAVEATIEKFKKIDILVCNAGIFENTRLEDINEDEWDKIFNVNVKGYFLCTQVIFPIMKKQEYGKIIYIGSSAAKNGGLLAGPHYVASKGAIHSFVKWIAKYGASFGIYANVVAPSLTSTDLLKGHKLSDEIFPLGRTGKPSDIAEAVVFFASQESNWISGTILDVNGGIIFG